MKILILHTSYKYQGGEDTVVSEELKLLRSNGITVETLEFDNDKGTLLNVLQMPFNVGSYIRTRKKLRSFQADVVHIHNMHFAASPSVIYAVKKAGVPLVFTLHNYRLICPSATLFFNGKIFLDSLKQSFPWKAVSMGVYKNSKPLTFWLSFSMYLHKQLGTWQIPDKFIMLTPYAKNVFLSSSLGLKEERIAVKPNFCKTPQLVRSNHAGYFLYIGRLSDEKGIAMMLETFSGSSHKLKIAGDGPLLDLVRRYSLEHHNIEYAGVVNKDEVFELINNSSALIFPSVWHEGMPLTIIESFANGVPVIASRLGAMEYMIKAGYNGLHFEAGNKGDLLAKLDEFESLPAAQKKIFGDNALRTYKESYSPEKNLIQLLSIYEAAAHKKGRPSGGMQKLAAQHNEFADEQISV